MKIDLSKLRKDSSLGIVIYRCSEIGKDEDKKKIYQYCRVLYRNI